MAGEVEPMGTKRIVDDPKAISGALTVLSGGFGLLSTLLAYFGIRDGTLNDLVRTEPTAAVWVCLLIGSGVALSLVIPALSFQWKIPFAIPVFSLVAIAALNLAVLPDPSSPAFGFMQKLTTLSVSNIAKYVIAGLVLLLGVVSLCKRVTVEAPIALLLVAVIFVGAGLYGAAAIIASQLGYPEKPAVSALISDNTLSVTVHAGLRPPQNQITIMVTGLPPETYEKEQAMLLRDSILARKLVTGNRNGVFDASLTTPINAAEWNKIRVWACSTTQGDPAGALEGMNNGDLADSTTCGWADVAGNKVASNLKSDPLVTGQIDPNTDQTQLKVSAVVVSKLNVQSTICMAVVAVPNAAEPKFLRMGVVSVSPGVASTGYESSVGMGELQGESRVELRVIKDCANPGRFLDPDPAELIASMDLPGAPTAGPN